MKKLAAIKKASKQDRQMDVLIGLVDLYLKSGRPIGSNTLKDTGFKHLSSATIRNYFAKLEIEGFLKQHHASGGRVPTDKAYRLYAAEKIDQSSVNKDDDLFLSSLLFKETREISTYLQEAVQALSELTDCAAFLASPRFDQDFIINIQLLQIDDKRILCALLTDFGLIHTEVLYYPHKLTPEGVKAIEAYFQFRLTGTPRPKLSEEDEAFAKQSYNEIVLRHFVSYTNMQFEDVYKSGFSKLLIHPEFHDPMTLANTLSLFENTDTIRHILQTCFKENELKYWIGDDLKNHMTPPYFTSIIAIPYYINQKIVGVIAVLGPDRLQYGKVFGLLEKMSEYLSENLTKTMYKYKLTYRQPNNSHLNLDLKQSGFEMIKLTHKTPKESPHE